MEDIVARLADAIAYAEGFFVTGSRAARNNNPGNITLDITGTAVGRDDIFMVYATATDGWEALKKQVRMMLDNSSRIYNSAMSIIDVARRYTTTEQDAWARNVAYRLGVDPGTRISDLAGAGLGVGVVAIFAVLWFLYRKGK